jgi:hypothetical protein
MDRKAITQVPSTVRAPPAVSGICMSGMYVHLRAVFEMDGRWGRTNGSQATEGETATEQQCLFEGCGAAGKGGASREM